MRRQTASFRIVIWSFEARARLSSGGLCVRAGRRRRLACAGSSFGCNFLLLAVIFTAGVPHRAVCHGLWGIFGAFRAGI